MAVKPVNVGAFTFYLFVATKLNLIAALRLCAVVWALASLWLL